MKNFKPSDKRILIATVPADGHFNPLTGLAVHLQDLGYDVRWYTSVTYADQLNKLGIKQYTLQRAFDISTGSPAELFPERNKIRGGVKRLAFDLTHAFILRSTEYFEDIKEIYQQFRFDLVICDCTFAATPFIREKLRIPVISIGVLPLTETSKDLPPMGMGMLPSATFWGKRKQDLLRLVVGKILFRHPEKVMVSLLEQYGIPKDNLGVFDRLVRHSTLLLQSGTPGFEYTRTDLGKNVRFIGPLLPYRPDSNRAKWSHAKLAQYKKIVLVTQGTVEKDVNKLLVPALDAFRSTDYLLVVATGGSETRELREKYIQPNIIIEDFIPFHDIMPHVDVYITNGGYGGVMLAIQHGLPMVVAGIHEGKSEINARVEYFRLGINLRTECPSATQVWDGVKTVLRDSEYRENVKTLGEEFLAYQPAQLVENYVKEVLTTKRTLKLSLQRSEEASFW